ncbi:hypothetical protein [Burkholderia cenocepacia]|uniref:hypothetical protein n=1 Tax=Burkholderia cenocepacia TaxID=95486 RepID=UPI0011155BFC|nr:hypothetical protein [Burkholderia cenocepacia]
MQQQKGWTWRAYRDDFTTKNLWHNDSFTDRLDFKKERILLHLEQGDIKIKFVEVLNKLKKLDEINITKPFIIYAMRRNGRTRSTGKDSFSYNKSLSIFFSSLISVDLEYIDIEKLNQTFSICSEIASSNGLSKEFEFLDDNIRKNGYGLNPHYSRKVSEFKELEAKWKKNNAERFKLNHRFHCWFSLFNSETITADQVKRFLTRKLIGSLDREMWEILEGYAHYPELELIAETPLYSSEQTIQLKPTRILPTDEKSITRSKRFMREVVIKSVLIDPIYFNYIAKDDMEDEEFAKAYLTRSYTDLEFKNIHQRHKNGNVQPRDHLIYFPDSICDNEKVVLLNYELNGSIEHASDRLKSDRDFILNHEINHIGCFSEELQNDFEFVKKWIEVCSPSNDQLFYVGNQLKNNLDYIEWLMNARYKTLTQENLDEDIIYYPEIGKDTINLCSDARGNFELELLNNLLEKNRFKKRLQIDLSNGKIETKTGKLKI